MTAEPTPAREPRRHRRRRRPDRDLTPDPTAAPPEPMLATGPVLKYDTRPPLDPGQVASVIDAWRRHGWTE